MFGLLFLLVVLALLICIMGFVLAFVHNLFEQDELAISRGIAIVFLATIAGIIIGIGLQAADLGEGATSVIATAANFLVLTGLIKTMAYTTFVRALLMALVFTVIMYIAGLVIGGMFATPAA